MCTSRPVNFNIGLKLEVTSAEYQKKKKIKMVVSKHLTHFCYTIRLVLHQHLNSHVAYPGIPLENSNHTRGRAISVLAIVFSS